MTLGELAQALQRREQDRRRPDRRRDEELAARRLVRRDRPALDQPVAEHAQHERGGALSGNRRDRGHEHLGRPRHRHAVRAARRAVDRRRRSLPTRSTRARSRASASTRSVSRPTSSKYANQECQGVFLIVTDRDGLHPVRVGVEIASALIAIYPSQYQLESAAHLLGSRETLARSKTGDDPAASPRRGAQAEAQWRLLRAKYLLYQ